LILRLDDGMARNHPATVGFGRVSCGFVSTRSPESRLVAYAPNAASVAGGDAERAVADLTEVVKANATQPFFLRAASYEMLGDFAKAQIDYEKAMKLEPSRGKTGTPDTVRY
jgi:tetratricopeptide (TPR) repeat protein